MTALVQAGVPWLARMPQSSPEQEFCRRFHRARRAAGISQVQLSRMTGIDPIKILRLEKGKCGLRLNDAVTLATALGIKVEVS